MNCKQKGVVCPMSEPQNAIIRAEPSYLLAGIEGKTILGERKIVFVIYWGSSQHLSEQEIGDRRAQFLL